MSLASKRILTVLSFVVIAALTLFIATGCDAVQNIKKGNQEPEQTGMEISDDIIYIKTSTPIQAVANGQSMIINNSDELNAFLAGIPLGRNEEGLEVPQFSAFNSHSALMMMTAGPTAITKQFTPTFFETNSLLCAPCEASSGSDTMYVEKITPVEGGYDVEFAARPNNGDVGTADMAYWVAMVPIPK